MKIIIAAEKPLTKDVIRNMIIMLIAMIILYLSISTFFMNHFIFNTVINGVDVSLMKYGDGYNKIESYINDYTITIEDKENEKNEMKGRAFSLKFHKDNTELSKIINEQRSFAWFLSLFKENEHHILSLYDYNKDDLKATLVKLPTFQKSYIMPMNPSFEYKDGRYYVVKEREGNQINLEKTINSIEEAVKNGRTYVNLEQEDCYEKPMYTIASSEVKESFHLLNKYSKTNITYQFDTELEQLDGSTLNKWLRVDDTMNVIIDGVAIRSYVEQLAMKYDTVGIARNFRNINGQIIEVKGGLYGWKMNVEEEILALTENIKNGKTLVTEPFYSQTAISRSKKDIGDTYIEINISQQYLWYFINGTVYVSGSIVTGNPSTGHSTVIGTNMIEYKEENAVLRGQDYEAEVKYWMPFYGSMGMHDAKWREKFGGEIYKYNGSHGCVNLPEYLAKRIYDKLEVGTPVITYVEKSD